MNYHSAVVYLENEIGFASVPGLSRILALLERIGNPQDKLRCIHIAGTNGKGSACAMLSAILQQNGYRTAVYTSPHLERYVERFMIDGIPITEDAFAAEIAYMREKCLEMQQDGEDVPTLFEILTAAAFHYFANQNVDILILEVGLGGRYDATNVIKQPLLSLIMSISMDHTDFLGNTLMEIAKEKCGIIKKNCPVVLYAQEESVYNIAKNTAKANHAPLWCASDRSIVIHKQDAEGTIFSVESEWFSYQNLYLPLLGSYQIENCITVLNACAVLQKNGLSLTKERICQGLAKAKWPGRMEIVGQNPLVILDGAHNADGIAKLALSLPLYAKDKKITLILGVLGDKEYDLMLSEIFPYIHQAVLTEPQNERRLDIAHLQASAAIFHKPMYLEKEIPRAYLHACKITKQSDMILACGSLYMIGALRTFIQSYGVQEEDALC